MGQTKTENPSITYQNITVKFKINQEQTVAQKYSNLLTISKVRNDIATKFKLDSKYLSIQQNGKDIGRNVLLAELVRKDCGITEFDLVLNSLAHEYNSDENNLKKIILDTDVYFNQCQLPDFISVHIPIDSEEGKPEVSGKRIVVEIVNQPITKPFLGGYVNNETGIEFHNTITQTGPAFENIKWDGIVSEGTQTVSLKDSQDDTDYSRSSQAFGDARKLIYIPNVADYNIEPQPYETHFDMERRLNKIQKIKIIQKAFRRYLLRKLIKESAAKWRAIVVEQERRDVARKTQFMNTFINECITKSYPKTRQDFNVLHAQVHKWKQDELNRINEMYSDGPRIAELHGVLDKEIELLNAIENKRAQLVKHLNEVRISKHLQKIGEPIKWIGYRNIVCAMDTLRTQKIRFMTNIYENLKKSTNKSTRLNLIDQISNILKDETNQKVVTELKSLLDRERELLDNEINNESMDVLRKRQLPLFLDLIKELEILDPENNEKRMCDKCHIIRHIKEFEIHARLAIVNTCQYCACLRLPPVDISIYKQMLRSIRRGERKRSALSSIAFIIQAEDIERIVENIWHGHSILSQNDIRKELRLPRWNNGDDWSPWNCVLLTDSEAQTHLKFNEVEKVYSDYIRKNIEYKHLQGKLTFKQLANVDFDFVESGEWENVGLDGKTI